MWGYWLGSVLPPLVYTIAAARHSVSEQAVPGGEPRPSGERRFFYLPIVHPLTLCLKIFIYKHPTTEEDLVFILTLRCKWDEK